ncbi:MAG TPA: endonuclease NucS domain-containing protein [Patescibacteria group bacterium]|nr:endonuclease NucS domain-containing protein [Patescibacteria group bacterium]
MQANAFRDWLRAEELQETYISSRISNCRRVEREQKIDLDAEFERDQLTQLVSDLTYTAKDEVNKKANPTNIKINGSLIKGLGTCKRAVKLYQRFRQGNSNDVNDIVSDDLSMDSEDLISDENADIVFGLESQLRDFIAQNIQSIPVNGKKLSLFTDGVEYSTEAGIIDILAVDDKGNFVVFELKRGRTPDHVMGQLVRYMGWVKQSIAKDKEVHGVIVAKTIKENLHYAKAIVPNVSLLQYEVKFQFKDAVSGVN